MDWVRFKSWPTRASIGALVIASMVGAVPVDNAVISNSGSTNTAGYRIEVSSDGTATVATKHGVAEASTAPKSFSPPAEIVKRFFADLAAARKANLVTEPCMKSASFGTSTHISWRGWVSPDLDCPPSGALGAALVRDVQALREASGLSAAPMRAGPVQVRGSLPPR